MGATVAGWISYAAARGVTVADEPATAQALLRGADHIAYRYLNRMSETTIAGLPTLIESATYIAAQIELTAPNFFSGTTTRGNEKILTKAEGIGWTAVGGTSAKEFGVKVSTVLEEMFAPYVYDRDEDGGFMMVVG